MFDVTDDASTGAGLGPRQQAAAGSSPAASGPAGPLFEGQVGAHYLLTMLAEAEPRGLPRTRIERVEFQRAGEGHPLDDVIVRGSTAEGLPTNLDIQVKRTITFAPSDPVFRDVAEQLGRAIPTLDSSHLRQQYAVATERSSAKITGPYKDVLRWARELGSATLFFERLARPQVGNDDMRTFVETLRTHLKDRGAASNDETLWQLFRRFNILHFDYSAAGSQSLELALERSRNVLHADDVPRAPDLWDFLTTTALQAAAAGGERSRADLVAELATSFRLTGSTRNRHARDTLAEAAALASQNLQRTIAGVSLARSAQIAAVREAAEQGRYVEIRGVAGVGKSGLLGAFLSDTLREGQAIVLTPDRTPAGGWVGFKSHLRIQMGPEAFLSDVASDGGAILFIDSLDFFSDPARATAIDLVQAAARVPAMTIIVTARSDFDKDTPNWLPADALEWLGRAPVVTVNELQKEEIAELKAGAPALKALLGDNHPAKSVARNLFRLSRLLEVGTSAEEVRSEVDLLDRWWKTGDGPADTTQRGRRRILAALADATLNGQDRVQTESDEAAIKALEATNSILELHLDHVAFAKDTLRDWAVASRLHDDPKRLAGLVFERPAPPSLSRGIELAARLSLERSSSGDDWAEFLTQVSSGSAHGSWRRWSLLAILRSERADDLLDNASAILFANGGALLRELIRTAIAVESRPMSEVLADLEGFDPSTAKDLYAPANRSWFTLAFWLVERRSDIPLEALPDIVDLFQNLSMATFFLGPLAAILADPLADWLDEIELARDHSLYAEGDPPRARSLFSYHDLLNLSNDLRHAFALMAASVPDRAQAYLRQVQERDRLEEIAGDILKFRGTFAKAAPAELADLTLKSLIPDDIEEHRSVRRMRDEPFNHLDQNLLPSSPSQGPFLELLNASPEDGLRVVRTLAAHAVAYYARGEEPGDNQIVIPFEGGPRSFPWANTYNWSRGHHCLYALESALMALEAWGHQRLERGDPAGDVFNDILGPVGSPAAFLLVGVDLLLSHWLKALAAGAPLLASPELLALDRTRQIHDDAPDIDLLGWGNFGPKEPIGPVNLASLNARPSRGACLEQLLPHALFRGEVDDAWLRQELFNASTRLGEPEAGDTFDIPRFMARYALNQLDRANWRERSQGVFEYEAPDAESRHLAAIQTDRQPDVAQFGLEAQIQLVVEDKSKSRPDLPARAAAHAKQLQQKNGDPDDALNMRAVKIASAAMIVARDGEDSLVAGEEAWVRSVFKQALAEPNTDAATGMRNGIRFNPVAIAAVGIGEFWRRYGNISDRNWLLEVAARPDSDAVQGLAVALPHIRSADDRLVRSVLRVAFRSQIRPEQDWEDDSGKVNAERAQHYRSEVAAGLAAELAWLDGNGDEPAWPSFPRRKRHLRNAGRSKFREDDDFEPETDGKIYVASQTCARWLRLMTRDEDSADKRWLPGLIGTYEPWTLYANGAGLEPSAEINGHLDDWNSTFFRLFARMLPDMPEPDAIASVYRAVDVPDEPFFEIATYLVPNLDALYFNDQGGSLDLVLKLRAIVAERLLKTDGWRWEKDRTEPATEVHIGPAISVMFFNHRGFNSSEAYLKPKGVDRAGPFLRQLEDLIAVGPVPYTAIQTMNLLEVAPNPSQLDFFLTAASTWLKRQPDNTSLWIDHGLGVRLAQWLNGVIEAEPSRASPDQPGRLLIDDVLARLVRLGVPGAHALEKKLSS